MADAPLLLALVHTPAVRDALAKAAGFDVRWSIEEAGHGKAGKKANGKLPHRSAAPRAHRDRGDRPADWLPRVHADSATPHSDHRHRRRRRCEEQAAAAAPT
jgi:hypothetical protein